MKDFIITCSSTCDLSPYYLRQHNIYYVSFFYYLDDNKYYDDFFKEHSVDEFHKLIKTTDVKTSQPDPDQYKELWIKLINQGYDILHIELSSGISGALNSALIAKSMVEESYPDARIHVIDSLCASTGYGLLLDQVACFKKDNNDFDKVVDFTEKTKLNINHIFFCTSLEQLIKGGRISKLAGNVGKLLNIVPILHVNNEGKLESIKKARGFSNAIDETLNLVKSNIVDGENHSNKIFFCHTNCYDSVLKFYNKTKDIYKKAMTSEDYIFNVGTVIASHTGDGTMSIFYVGNGRA